MMPERRVLGNLSSQSAAALIEIVGHTYGRRKTPEEIEFTEQIGKKFDRHVIPIFLMTLWVGIVSHSKIFMIIFQHPKVVRCVIPEFEGHFSFEQILNLTVRTQDDDYGHYCYYDKRDYAGYVETYGYDYDRIMTAINEAPDAYREKCTDIVKKIKEKFDDIGEVENAWDHLQLYCESRTTKRAMDIAIKYGQFILGVPIGVIGDFCGRRTAFLFAATVFSMGVGFTLIDHVATLIIGRFLVGSSMILFYTVFVIFIESTNIDARKKVALLLHESIAIGRFVEFIMYRTLKRFRLIVYINAVMCIFMIIPVFCINESPRWLYFSGYQQKAYKVLGVEHPGATNNPRRRRLGPHFKYFTLPVFRKRFMVHMITIWCTSSVTFLIRSKFSRDITNFPLKDLLDSGILMGSCCVLMYVLMLIIGRGRTIMVFFTMTTIVDSFLFFNPRSDRLCNQIFLVISVTLTENATFFAFYMISEMYPNEIRFTGYGFCTGIHGFGDIFHFHLMSYKIPLHSMFFAPLFLISSISLVSTHFQVETGGPFLVADYPRESMKESDFKEIAKSVVHEEKKRMLG